MIKARGGVVKMIGSGTMLMAETEAVLASCYRMLVKTLGEDDAREAFAEIGRNAIETANNDGEMIAMDVKEELEDLL